MFNNISLQTRIYNIEFIFGICEIRDEVLTCKVLNLFGHTYKVADK